MTKPVLPPDFMRDLDTYERRISALERRMSELILDAIPDHTHELPEHTHEVPEHTHDLSHSYYYLTAADLFNTTSGGFEGWDLDGFPNPCFVRQGNLCTLMGVVSWVGNPSASYPYSLTSIIRHDLIPFEFRPTGIRRFLGFTGGGGEVQLLWQLYLDTNGSMYMDSSHTSGTPAPWGGITGNEDYLPISFDFTYQIAPIGNFDNDGPQGVVLPEST